jgi:predicted LPLAT superfamily acyltransferase
MARQALTAPPRERAWLSTAERGSVLGFRLIAWLSTAVGRTPARFVVRIVALYYFVFDGAARRASHDYLMRVHGNATLAMRYRHLLRFAEVTLDRAFIVAGKERYFDVTCNGKELLPELRKRRRGAVLLGAHVGSFEAMRMQGKKENLRVHVLGYFRNARMINAALERLNPSANTSVIAIDDSNPDFILRIRERVESGDLIGILGDRVGRRGRSARVKFLGEDASFPTGAYLVASILRCPIYLTFALYREPNRYDLYCEPFEDEVRVPRDHRDEALAAYAQKFACRLEDFVRRAPDNWFNFYDFWERS